MRQNRMRYGYACVLGALLWWPPSGLAGVSAAKSPAASATAAPPALAAMADYRRKLAAYTAAHRKYEAAANAYWSLIADKRRIRNAKRHGNKEILIEDYVLTQPPVYAGPPQPVDPSAPAESKPPKAYVPVVADFLQSAAKHFSFVPQRPQSEIEFKRAYAQVAAAAGLTREQAVRIYGFESGGNGKYDVQAGLEHPSSTARAISTALGYNQLLATNSVELLAEKGEQFLRSLRGRAAELTGDDRKALERKIAVLKAMVDFSRSVPDDWSQHDRLANSPESGSGRGPIAASPEAARLRGVRARQGLRRAPDRSRARDDEPDRRRQRHRHGAATGGMARPGPDRELLPAGRLRAQPGRQPQQCGRQAVGRDRGPDG